VKKKFHPYFGFTLMFMFAGSSLLAVENVPLGISSTHFMVGGWADIFTIKNDFLTSVENMKCSVKYCWLPLGIYFISMYGLLRIILSGPRKNSAKPV